MLLILFFKCLKLRPINVLWGMTSFQNAFKLQSSNAIKEVVEHQKDPKAPLKNFKLSNLFCKGNLMLNLVMLKLGKQ